MYLLGENHSSTLNWAWWGLLKTHESCETLGQNHLSSAFKELLIRLEEETLCTGGVSREDRQLSRRPRMPLQGVIPRSWDLNLRILYWKETDYTVLP